MARYTPQWLQAGSYAASQDRRLISALWPAPASSGGAATVSIGTMSVVVAAGAAAVPSQNFTGSTLCTWDAAETVTHAAAPGSGTNRIDVITCHPRGADLDGGTNTDFIIDIIAGAVAATPVVPATPAGQIALWQVFIPGGAAALVAGNLTDVRPGGLAVPAIAGAGSPPRGYLAYVNGPPAQLDSTSTPVSLCAVTIQVVAGRWYRTTGFINGTIPTGPANPRVSVGPSLSITPGLMTSWVVASNNVAAASVVCATGIAIWQATATGPATFQMNYYSTAGVLRVTAGSCYLAVEDIGAS